MKVNPTEINLVEHLNDGAYVTVNSHSFYPIIMTANHHDPNQATDMVAIDHTAMERLYAILKQIYGKDGD